MFKHILVPLDGSVNAEKISGWAEGLAESFESDLTLLIVVDPDKVERSHDGPGRDRPAQDASPLDQVTGRSEQSGGIPYGESAGVGAETGRVDAGVGFGTQFIEQAAEIRNKYVTTIAERLSERGIQVRAKVTIGVPEEEILRVVEEENIDLITMATHRESVLVRGVLGSVTDRVIHHSPVPILAIRPESVSETSPHKPEVVLVPLDGSEVSESVVPLAMNIAKKSGAHLLFARVTSTPYQSAMGDAGVYYPSPMVQNEGVIIAGEYLEPFVDKAKKAGISASMQTPTGGPAQCLISLAEENDTTMIVIGTRGQSGLKRLIVGSVTDKVIRASGHPVLVVPPKH